MHCESPSTSPNDVCRLQLAVPVSTTGSDAAPPGVLGPGAELQFNEHAATAASDSAS